MAGKLFLKGRGFGPMVSHPDSITLVTALISWARCQYQTVVRANSSGTFWKVTFLVIFELNIACS
jgi:hypothetical protein